MVDFSSIEDLVSSAIADQSDVPQDFLWDPDKNLHNSIIKQEVVDPVSTQESLFNAALKASGLGGGLKLSGALGGGGDVMTSGFEQMLMPTFKESQEDQDDMLLSLYNTLIEDGTVWQPDNGLNSTASMKTEEEIEKIVQLDRLTSPLAPLQRFTTVDAVRVQSISAASVATPVHRGSVLHRFGASRGLPPAPLVSRTPNFGSLTTYMTQSLSPASGVVAGQKSGKLVKELSKR